MHLEESKKELFATHVQIDEAIRNDITIFEKFNPALSKLKSYGIIVNLIPTIEMVVGISRLDMCRWGSEELHSVDKALRSEIDLCMGNKSKGLLNTACDALIALSSLNHDYFITGDRCLAYSWNKVIEQNPQNRIVLSQKYSIPKIIKRSKPLGVLNAIICS